MARTPPANVSCRVAARIARVYDAIDWVQSGLDTMANWFARVTDVPADGLSQNAGRLFSKPSRLYEASGARDRAPLALAILSVVFEASQGLLASSEWRAIHGEWLRYLYMAGIVVAALRTFSARTSRWAVAIFTGIAAIALLPDWRLFPNHIYLALWTIPVAIVFKEWWRSDLYAVYLRVTLGVVMIAAFSQKILAGTYVDGSYFTWLGAHGSLTERMFSLFCDSASADPCRYYQFISIFILAWQLAVGILLLLGLNSLIFLAIEIGFLLGAGVYADEMNFQVLNIALMCIVFRFGLPLWLLIACAVLLVIDVFTISTLAALVIGHA
jgi:hypothetical protein